MVPPIDRRSMLTTGVLSWTPWAFPALLSAGETPRVPHAKACLLLYMDGGPSHLDTFDLKPEAPDDIRGPFGSIATSVPGINVCEHLPRVARQMHHLWQVRSVRHEELVHDPAVYQMLTGYKHISSAGGLEVEDTDLPHMGSALARADRVGAALPTFLELPDRMTMQGRVLPGQTAGVLGASWDPFQVHVSPAGVVTPPQFARLAEIADGRLNRRRDLWQALEQDSSVATERTDRFTAFQQQSLQILNSPTVSQAFDLERESPATRDRYGWHRHGASVLLARRLLEAGARFITVYWGNEEQDWADGRPAQVANNPWDTHRNHFPLVRDSLLPRADQTLAALLEDLSQRGLLDEVLVVWMGDFGRTPRINRQFASRDHWPHAFTVLFAGAGLPAGTVYGQTDRRGEFVTDNPVSPADLTATIFRMLGVDPATDIPTIAGARHPISMGRPISAAVL